MIGGVLLPSLLALAAFWPGTAWAQTGQPRAPQEKAPARKTIEPLSREDVVQALQKAMGHLIEIQNADGSWGGGGPESTLEDNFALETYASWRLGAHAIGCMALMGSARGDLQQEQALEKAVDWLCAVSLPERDSDWDVDYVWAAVYGFSACVDLLQDKRFQVDPWVGRLEERGKEFLAVLVGHQALSGGWAYYDFAPYAKTPTWATSFTTAAVLPALFDATQKLKWEIEERVLARAVRYVDRCALPNGAYAYDLTPNLSTGGIESINQVQGSLSRIQVCNWALHRAGVKRITPEVLRKGLENFFRYHGFLDHVRTRPIPHEGFNANAGYFYFFGHYYAAKVIALLPAAERAEWYKKLSPHLAKTQWANGGASDFLRPPYMVVASTSFLLSGLQADLDALNADAKDGARPQKAERAPGEQPAKADPK